MNVDRRVIEDMKKMIMILLIIFTTFFLIGCGLRERLLAPPDEWIAPEGTQIAVCTVGEDIYTHVYKDDGIYQYYINDVLQGDAELDAIQESVFLNGENFENYLKITYNIGECVIEDYYTDSE